MAVKVKLALTSLFLVVLMILSGCTSAPQSYTKGLYERPKKILITLQSDPRGWREDWRSAFESHGYDVGFHDEVLISNITEKIGDVSIERKNVLRDKEIKYELRLRYVGEWDIVWYVKYVDLTVRELATGKIVGNYRDENVFAHPGVPSVVENLERKFLSSLWLQH